MDNEREEARHKEIVARLLRKFTQIASAEPEVYEHDVMAAAASVVLTTHYMAMSERLTEPDVPPEAVEELRDWTRSLGERLILLSQATPATIAHLPAMMGDDVTIRGVTHHVNVEKG